MVFLPHIFSASNYFNLRRDPEPYLVYLVIPSGSPFEAFPPSFDLLCSLLLSIKLTFKMKDHDDVIPKKKSGSYVLTVLI